MTTATDILHLESIESLALINEKMLIDEQLSKLSKHKKIVDQQIKKLMGKYENAVCKKFLITLKSQSRTRIDFDSIVMDYPNINVQNYTHQNIHRVLRIRKEE